jgi:hypothetical protein
MKKPQELPDKITDEPGMEERFQRALRQALNTPPKHRTSSNPEAEGTAGVKGPRSQGEDANLDRRASLRARRYTQDRMNAILQIRSAPATSQRYPQQKDCCWIAPLRCGDLLSLGHRWHI